MSTESVRRERCGTCKWWDGDNTNPGPPSYDSENSGPCRRYPPQQLTPDTLVQTNTPLIEPRKQRNASYEPFTRVGESGEAIVYTVPDDRDVETACYRWTAARDWCGEWAPRSADDDWEEVDIVPKG